MNLRPALVLAAVAISAAGLAGCSTAASPDTMPTHTAPLIGCGYAPAAKVGKALDMDLQEPKETDQSPVTVCTYLVKKKSDAVVVRFQTEVDAKTFTETQRGFTGAVAQLDGLGDQAFTATMSGGKTATNSVAARQGSVAVVVTSTASIAKEKALIRDLLPALPASPN